MSPGLPERLAIVETETRHTRELLEQHVLQTKANFDYSDKQRAEQTEKLDRLLSAMERGKGGLLVLGLVIGMFGGAVGSKIAGLIGSLIR